MGCHFFLQGSLPIQSWTHTCYISCTGRQILLHWKALLSWAAAAAKVLQLCPTLCDSGDGSPLGSPVPGILQARTLEWVAISFSNAWKWKVKVKSLSRVLLFVTPWTAAYQAPLSMGFSRQEYWSGVPLPSPLPFLKKKLHSKEPRNRPTWIESTDLWWMEQRQSLQQMC